MSATNNSTVYVIDDDPLIQRAVRALAGDLNLACQVYARGGDFLQEYKVSQPGCLVLEVKIPDISGPLVQRELAARQATLPLIFLSQHADVSLTVELMRRGAACFLQKPPRSTELLNAILDAIELDQRRREEREIGLQVSRALAELTPRERDVLRLIAEGVTNDALAGELNVSRRTVELDRARIMAKLRLRSAISLVHFALLAYPRGPYAQLTAAHASGQTRSNGNGHPVPASSIPLIPSSTPAPQTAAAERSAATVRMRADGLVD